MLCCPQSRRQRRGLIQTELSLVLTNFLLNCNALCSGQQHVPDSTVFISTVRFTNLNPPRDSFTLKMEIAVYIKVLDRTSSSHNTAGP
jgi:hypothetical protein